ncbi:MAG: hypothetical protein D6718_13705 [Acidobacteria bacterium]|nr:MAG: hypothetical protein D6718_13705 [Acidobacteriota bacterium]
MRSRTRWSAAILTAWLAATCALAGRVVPPSDPPGAAAAEPSEPFARVRYSEGGLRAVRADGFEEDLGYNAPLFEGDRVRTSAGGRAELQLPDGALVRLDRSTLVELFAFASPEGEGTTVLGLHEGRVQIDAPAAESVRVDTPSASVYVLERSAFLVAVRDGERAEVTVESGRVEVSGEEGSVLLLAGERTTVAPGRAPRSPWPVNLLARDGFTRWVAERDDVFHLRHRPGPEYTELPEPVRPYYPELSRYGRWVWNETWGWTWVPDVEPDWRPYVRGYWEVGPVGPVWVGYEPWGWPVYRFGRWDFWPGYGWVWIPGAVFAPAHVVWYYGPEFVGWCPLGHDGFAVTVGISFGWGDPFFDVRPWVFVDYAGFWVRGWAPHRHHRYYVDGHRAAEVRHRIVRDEGIVTRRRLVPADTRHGRPAAGGATRTAPWTASREHLYERARRLLSAPGSDAREVREWRAAAVRRAAAAEIERARTGTRLGRSVPPSERTRRPSPGSETRTAPAAPERVRPRPGANERRAAPRPAERRPERSVTPPAPVRRDRPVIRVRPEPASPPSPYPARHPEREAPAPRTSFGRAAESVRRFLSRIVRGEGLPSPRSGPPAGSSSVSGEDHPPSKPAPPAARPRREPARTPALRPGAASGSSARPGGERPAPPRVGRSPRSAPHRAAPPSGRARTPRATRSGRRPHR